MGKPTAKQLEARKLRDQGMNYSQIAAQLGISNTSVRRRLYGASAGVATTEVGDLNRNKQRAIEKTDERGPNGNSSGLSGARIAGTNTGYLAATSSSASAPNVRRSRWVGGVRPKVNRFLDAVAE
jgi:hypothetical protein